MLTSTHTTTTMATSTATDAVHLTPAALLQLLQLASPALPVGGFSYSESLESAVDSGRVADESSAVAWLLDQLHLSRARSDLPAMAQAFSAWQRSDSDRVREINDWLVHTRDSAELRQQNLQMGRSMAEWLKHHESRDERLATLHALAPAPTWPVAFALAAVYSGAQRPAAMLAFAFGWAANMVAAAMRCVPLGQIAGQRMLARLIAQLPQAVQAAEVMHDAERQAFTPMLAILGALHESQYSRLFRS